VHIVDLRSATVDGAAPQGRLSPRRDGSGRDRSGRAVHAPRRGAIIFTVVLKGSGACWSLFEFKMVKGPQHGNFSRLGQATFSLFGDFRECGRPSYFYFEIEKFFGLRSSSIATGHLAEWPFSGSQGHGHCSPNFGNWETVKKLEKGSFKEEICYSGHFHC